MALIEFNSIVGCDDWLPPYSRNRQYQKRPVEELFWKHVDKTGPQVRLELSECWVWVGGRCEKGYGAFGIRGHIVPAHRFAWLLAWEHVWGPLLNGELVCHRCDNPVCVRATHLFVGSAGVNARDRAAKGRVIRWQGIPAICNEEVGLLSA